MYTMQDWSFDFSANNNRKMCQVHVNGDFDHGKVLYVESDWTIYEFLNAASQRLDMVPAATRVFNADGVEVDDVMMIVDDDILFLSMLADFIPPRPIASAADDLNGETSSGGGDSNDHLPSLIGGYKVGALLGKGGFGEVRVGEHSLTGGRVALKFMKKSEIHSLGAATRTNTEIQCLFALKHANIIRLQQHLESPNHVILVFELMEGGDLLKYLATAALRRGEARVREQKRLQVQAELRGGAAATADDEDEPDEQSNIILDHPPVIEYPHTAAATAAAAVAVAAAAAPATAVPSTKAKRGGSGRRATADHSHDEVDSSSRTNGHTDAAAATSASGSAKNDNSLRYALTEEEAKHVFYQVLSAVSYAHNQHICHRDLKLENILLKDNTLATVKIADFGLSDFYRPGAVMKSSCGTLSFLAPEVFKGTANAGPPLDVWSMGVILFALLCGRLPFEGPSLVGGKRPRDAVIKSRILKCQYKIDESLGLEAKDLLRRLLHPDPGERATIPEVFNHVWLRSYGSSSSYVDFQILHSSQLNSAASGGAGNRFVRKSSSYNSLQSVDGADKSSSAAQRLSKPSTGAAHYHPHHHRYHKEDAAAIEHDKLHGPGSTSIQQSEGTTTSHNLIGEGKIDLDMVVDQQNNRTLKCNSPVDGSLLHHDARREESSTHLLPPIVPLHHNQNGASFAHKNQHLHEHNHVHHFAAIEEDAEVDLPSPHAPRMTPSPAPFSASKSRSIGSVGISENDSFTLGGADYHEHSSSSINSFGAYTPSAMDGGQDDSHAATGVSVPTSPRKIFSSNSQAPRPAAYSQPHSRSNSGTYVVSLSRECSRENLQAAEDALGGPHNNTSSAAVMAACKDNAEHTGKSKNGAEQSSSAVVVTSQFRLVPLRRQNSKDLDSPEATPRKSAAGHASENASQPPPPRNSPMINGRRASRGHGHGSDEEDEVSVGTESDSVTSLTYRRGQTNTHGHLAASKRNRSSVYAAGYNYLSGSPVRNGKDSSSHRRDTSGSRARGQTPHYASPVGAHRERGRRGQDEDAMRAADAKDTLEKDDNADGGNVYAKSHTERTASILSGVGALDIAISGSKGIANGTYQKHETIGGATVRPVSHIEAHHTNHYSAATDILGRGGVDHQHGPSNLSPTSSTFRSARKINW